MEENAFWFPSFAAMMNGVIPALFRTSSGNPKSSTRKSCISSWLFLTHMCNAVLPYASTAVITSKRLRSPPCAAA